MNMRNRNKIIAAVMSACLTCSCGTAFASDKYEIESSERYLRLKQSMEGEDLLCIQDRQLAELLTGPAVAETLKNLKAFCAGVTSYISYRTIKDLNASDDAEPAIQWEIKYVHPDRLLVMQTAEEDTGTIYDHWMTIGDQIYFYIGAWFIDEGGMTGHEETNRFLGLDKWLALLENNDDVSGRVMDGAQGRVIVLTLQPQSLAAFGPFSDVNSIESKRLEIWIDPETGHLRRAALKLEGLEAGGEVNDILIEQYFGEYNSDIKIEKPENVYKVEDAEKVLKKGR